MGRGADNDLPLQGKEPRMNTSLMPAIIPQDEDFIDGYDKDRHYPPRVPAGRNINIFPTIASTITEIPENEEVYETMRRVIHQDIDNFTGTDELYYYFQTNHEGLTITYPDGTAEVFTISDTSISSTRGDEGTYTYLDFPDDFYIDPYRGKDPVMSEKKRLEEEIEKKVEERMKDPQYQKDMEEIFDFVDSREEWDKKAADDTLNPDGKITVIRTSEKDFQKVLEDKERAEKGLPPIHSTPPKPGDKPPWEN